MSFARRLLSILLPVTIGACSAGRPDDSVSLSQSPLVVGGCQCVSSGGCSGLTYSDVPSDGKYYVTTFGGGTDTGTMACGGTADGTWAYVADKARFACGVKLLVTANGKQCVAQVADCGPNRCVEEAASGSCGSHFPVLDASPYITKYLLGLSGVGWSDKKIVGAVPIDSTSVVGCPGVAVGGGGIGGSGGGSGKSAGRRRQLGRRRNPTHPVLASELYGLRRLLHPVHVRCRGHPILHECVFWRRDRGRRDWWRGRRSAHGVLAATLRWLHGLLRAVRVRWQQRGYLHQHLR